jgi:hypothetical protein
LQMGRVAAPTSSHRLCFKTKASSLVSSSNVELVGDDFGPSSVTTRLAHAMSSSDASAVAALFMGSSSAHVCFLADRSPDARARPSDACALCQRSRSPSLSLDVPRRLKVGLSVGIHSRK